jgi:hypothetical protein
MKKLKSCFDFLKYQKVKRRLRDKRKEMADQSSCPLHRGRLTGGLYYAPNSMGNYSMYSPPCNGCSFGVEETAMYGRLATLSIAVCEAQADTTSDKMKVAWLALAACLAGNKGDELSQTLFYARTLQALQPTHNEVVDLLTAGDYAGAALALGKM